MKNVAVLLTCHNRKIKTLNSLRSLFRVKNTSSNKDFDMRVYLTDDGSTDGTTAAIQEEFPQVNILQGSGHLFWAEGMRNSWKEALKGNYDTYLLINDDVELYDNVFDQLALTDAYSNEKFGMGGIYLGATEDKFKDELTYSGSIITNEFLYKLKRLPPNGQFQECHLGNANIMMVSGNVVEKIGILTKGYSHGMADYDYTLMAINKKIPVFIAPEYCGHCVNDHRDHYENFINKSLEERRHVLYNPTGLALSSYKKYMKKFFPFRYPFVVVFAWLKLYFPKIYLDYFRR